MSAIMLAAASLSVFFWKRSRIVAEVYSEFAHPLCENGDTDARTRRGGERNQSKAYLLSFASPQ
jgi:hypothetical protein